VCRSRGYCNALREETGLSIDLRPELIDFRLKLIDIGK
jgi:hypothetical protein